MSRVWVYQDDKQVKARGAKAASWYVGWYDPDGRRKAKSCGPGTIGKETAEKLARKRQAELLTGTYQATTKTTWAEFRAEYESNVMEGMGPDNRKLTRQALDHFEAIVNPKKMTTITNRTLAEFVAERRGQKARGADGPAISPATVNKELRHIRAALRKARKWKYLTAELDFEFLKEAKKLPTYVIPEHFAALYQACDGAKHPKRQPYDPADWWRALLVFAYMTGWRVGAILKMQRDDLDLDAGFAVSRAADNKGKRDAKVPLHPLVIEHLRKLAGFTPRVFHWPLNLRRLHVELNKIQDLAGVKPEGGKAYYGFHDLRRAFATMNADKLSADALQHLMQHRDYQTTQRYINLGRQLNPALEALYVPDLTGKTKKA